MYIQYMFSRSLDIINLLRANNDISNYDKILKSARNSSNFILEISNFLAFTFTDEARAYDLGKQIYRTRFFFFFFFDPQSFAAANFKSVKVSKGYILQ